MFRSARKQYQAKRHFIINLQACVRRRAGRKQLIGLRTEARSANHFKEVSYKLENKVVELTQTLTQSKDEKKALENQARQLESEVQSWKDKYEKLQSKLQVVEEQHGESKGAQAELDALKQAHETLQENYNSVVAKSEEQDKEIARLNAEVTRLKQQPPLKVSTTLDNKGRSADEPDVAELKNQIAALKAQLSQSYRNAPRRQGSLSSYARNLSPVAMSPTSARRGISPDRGISPRGASPRGRSPTGAMASFRRNSIAETKRQQQPGAGEAKVVYAEPEQMRPMSIDHINTLRDADVKGNPEEAVSVKG